MKYAIGDIDVDVANREAVAAAFPAAIPAANKDGGAHPGLYFCDIPVNPKTGRAALDYEEAEQRGYWKLDVLNLNLYEQVRDEAHLIELMEREPDWDLLLDRNFSEKLTQIGNHPRVLEIVRPRSVEELAAAIALIRPGKKHLLECSKEEIMQRIWSDEGGGFSFKRSHAFAYALTVVLHMNLLTDELSEK